MKLTVHNIRKRPLIATLLISIGLALSGCGGEASKDKVTTPTTPEPAQFKVNTPKDIAQESAENYDDNLNGVVTGKTLKRWIGNWEKERPAGITGKLVIFQATKGRAGFEFIKPNNTNVFTYLENTWREPRFNGVTEIEGIVISGETTDALVRRYGIDLKNDLILCAQGTGGSAAMDQGRCWYTFRYWGVDAKNLAILDGGNNFLSGTWTAEDFTATAFSGAVANQPSPIINKPVSSVRDLGVDNTILQATAQDLINVLPTHDTNNIKDGYFLWDGRSLDQFSAGEASEAGGALANRYSSFQNNAPRQSHPRGAVNLNWTNLIDTATGLFKTKAQLRAYLEGNIDAAGKGFVDGTYKHVGAGNAYQKGDQIILWCETAARAAVTQIAAVVVLGLPTRIYDASMIEWNSLSAGFTDKDGHLILAKNSPWDTAALSAPYFPNKPELINARDAEYTAAAPRILDGFGANTYQVINEDKAYIRPTATSSSAGNGGNTTSSSSSSKGVTLPSNPCGG
jgi:3-mercaptopyruvate sulfurtransferase SseA